MEPSLVSQIEARKRGLNLGKYLQCLCQAKGNPMMALERARQMRALPAVIDTLELQVKAAVAAGTSTDSVFAGPLVPTNPIAAEFIELLAPLTVIGRLGLRRVDFNIKVARTTLGTVASWVTEGSAIPMTKMAFDDITLGVYKHGCLTTVSQELASLSTPHAASIISDDVVRTSAKFSDAQFLDPSVAQVNGLNPASINYGATNISSTGNTAAEVIADLKALFTLFTVGSAPIPLSQCVLVMSQKCAVAWASLLTTGGIPAFPNLTVDGGNIWGVKVLTSAYQVTGANSPTEEIVTCISPNDVLLADGGVIVDVSPNASVQMVDNPSSSATTEVSMWQLNMVSVRALRFINYLPRRTNAVAAITGINL